jgi:hypothetical protein
MSIKIVQLDLSNARFQGNLSRTPCQQLLRKLGVFNHVHMVSNPELAGTVRVLKTGKCWDWWMNEWGDVVTVPAT